MEGLPPLSKSSKTSKPGKMQRDCQQENKTPLSTSTNCPPSFSRAGSSTKLSGQLQDQQKSSPSQHLKQGCFSPQNVNQGPSSKISRPDTDRPPTTQAAASASDNSCRHQHLLSMSAASSRWWRSRRRVHPSVSFPVPSPSLPPAPLPSSPAAYPSTPTTSQDDGGSCDVRGRARRAS